MYVYTCMILIEKKKPDFSIGLHRAQVIPFLFHRLQNEKLK